MSKRASRQSRNVALVVGCFLFAAAILGHVWHAEYGHGQEGNFWTQYATVETNTLLCDFIYPVVREHRARLINDEKATVTYFLDGPDGQKCSVVLTSEQVKPMTDEFASDFCGLERSHDADGNEVFWYYPGPSQNIATFF